MNELLALLAEETGVPPALLDMGVRLAKLALVSKAEPEAYLQGLLDDVERHAQELARSKFG